MQTEKVRWLKYRLKLIFTQKKVLAFDEGIGVAYFELLPVNVATTNIYLLTEVRIVKYCFNGKEKMRECA